MGSNKNGVEKWIRFSIGIIFSLYFIYNYYEKGVVPNKWLMGLIAILVIGNMSDVIALVQAIRGHGNNRIEENNEDEEIFDNNKF